MGDLRKRGALLVLLAVFATGCGDSNNSGATTQKQERIYPNVHGPTREFLIRDGDNIVQFFGHEATTVQRKAVSEVIRGWMRARAAAAWAKDCTYMHSGYRQDLVKDAHGVSGGKVRNCPQALAFFGPSASGNLKNTYAGESVVSLRLRESRGYAQYHGNDGHDWIVAVAKDGGQWKVTTAAPLGRSS
jgi:hypothetical protein